MPKFAPLALLAIFAALLLGAEPAMSAPAKDKDAAAQAVSKPRARTQIRVTPRYPYRTYHSFYPVPYSTEYPGPNGVRHCVDRYVIEHRVAGTVLVPRMRCQWVVRR